MTKKSNSPQMVRVDSGSVSQREPADGVRERFLRRRRSVVFAIHHRAAQREALRRDIEEGCREMWDLYLETAKEWEPLEAEVDRLLDQ